MNESIFDKLDFGVLQPMLDDDDITDISILIMDKYGFVL